MPRTARTTWADTGRVPAGMRSRPPLVIAWGFPQHTPRSQLLSSARLLDESLLKPARTSTTVQEIQLISRRLTSCHFCDGGGGASVV